MIYLFTNKVSNNIFWGKIMILKYARKTQVALFFFFTTLKALEAVFIAVMLQHFISYSQSSTDSLLNLILISIAGSAFFAVTNIIFQKFRVGLIYEVNMNIKKIAVNYVVHEKNDEVGIDASFLTNDLKQVEASRIESELTIVYYGIQFIVAIIAGFISSPLLSVIFIVTSVIPGLIQYFVGPLIEKNAASWEEKNSKYTETVNESLNLGFTARLYNVEQSVVSRFVQAAEAMEFALKRTNWTRGAASELTESVGYLVSFVIPMAAGVFMVRQGQITLGTFMMITQLSNNFINPVINIFALRNNMKTSTPILKKFDQIKDLVFANDQQLENETEFTELKMGNVGVVLNKHCIFQNVNLNLKSKQKLLLEAPSGWGKSTLLNVLVGNLDPSEGQYDIDGQELNGDWAKAHQYYSFIQQNPSILDDTLKYNVTLGREISVAELDEVAKKAGLDELVAEKGWDYAVGKNGKNLSGGQNQRVEIARAIMSKRPIMIADEASSALDQNMSLQIHKTILEDLDGTVIEVAHKLNDAEKEMFDQVIELDKQNN